MKLLFALSITSTAHAAGGTWAGDGTPPADWFKPASRTSVPSTITVSAEAIGPCEQRLAPEPQVWIAPQAAPVLPPFRFEQVRKTTAELQQVGTPWRIARAAALMAAAVAGNFYLAHELPNIVKSEFVPYAQGLALVLTGSGLGWSLLTPVTEPFSAKVRRIAMLLVYGRMPQTANDPKLKGTWQNTQVTLTKPEQEARANLSSLINRGNFTEAYSKFKEGNHSFAANQIAHMAKVMRKRYRDLPYDDEDIIDLAQSGFTDNVMNDNSGRAQEVLATFAALVMERIPWYDQDAFAPGAQEYYRNLLNVWLGPKPRSSR